MKAIRNAYAEQGVENYYAAHGEAYQNPHQPFIAQLLAQNAPRLDYTNVLDLCAGGGEVTIALQKMGYTAQMGCDPFTHALYERNTGKKCWTWDFDAIVKGKMTEDLAVMSAENTLFSAVICSFAMHLCPEKMLFTLAQQLFMHTNNIVIVTPHKRPALENYANCALHFEDFVLTERGKKVFLKCYKSVF